MSKSTQTKHLIKWRLYLLKSTQSFLNKYSLLPLLYMITLLAISIPVMIITGRPIAGFALILGIPTLFLLCLYPKSVVYALIIYSFVVKFLVSDIGLGSIANYVCDGMLLMALFFAVTRNRVSSIHISFRLVIWSVSVFWIVATLSSIAHGVSFGLYLWACRNTFRLFGVLYCCVKLLDQSDIDHLIKFIFGFFFINMLVCTYQHFVLGVGQDQTNGLFGTALGGNAMMNVLMFAVCAFTLFGFLENKYPEWFLILIFIGSCYLAAIAELKFFYIELILLVVFAVVIQKMSFKMLLSVATIIIITFVGIQILIAFNPGFTNFFNWKEILNYSDKGGYTSAYDLNRMTAIQTLNDRFLNTQSDKLFGLGFGAGQFTQFFASPLYAAYGFLLHWNWFSDAAIFLETGYIGLILYILPFLFIALTALKSTGNSNVSREQIHEQPGMSTYEWINRACAAIALLCLLLIIYNCTLTTDPGCYFIGFVLSFPFLIQKTVIKGDL